jgi:hypothetical protein
MSEFSNLEHEVEDKGIEEAGQMVDDKTGGHFDSEVQQGEQMVEGDLGNQPSGY